MEVPVRQMLLDLQALGRSEAGPRPGPQPHQVLTQNLHLAPSTQQAEQAGFTREEITRRASQFSLKIDKRQSS
jgi:hypothetical protein